jgi:exodeoxyribonuclease VII large subunit
MRQPDLFEKLSAEDGTQGALTVTEITGRIRESLEAGFPDVTVVGEISNMRRPASGHIYLTLKDEKAQLRVVMFRGMQRGLTFEPEDGLRVRARGDISVYAARGEYQLIARGMMPDGVGALQQAFLKLKEKLADEGLFDDEKKKPIPPYPTRIAIVTSETGAAIRDMLRMIRSRSGSVDVALYPVRVQGEGSGDEIAAAIAHLNRLGGFDTIIIGRGGGSIEDLWAFNEEAVARAIYASKIPLISAVGHEIDITISDLVADRRALTPTEAGEIVVPDTESLLREIETAADGAASALTRILDGARHRLRLLGRTLAMRRPVHLLREKMQRVDDTAARIGTALSHLIALSRQKLKGIEGRLEAISPLAVLERGYSVTLDGKGKTLHSAAQVKPGDEISTVLSEGRVTSEVRKTAK